LRDQTLQPKETIVIRDTRPFHRAMNAGAARVTTPFFVQVDADMILDSDCIATMRSAIRDNTGLVFAHLRDRLIGEVVGVKLYRTSCFAAGGLSDSISPDTDFGHEIARAGWKTVELGRSRFNRWRWPTTLGTHDPCYTPDYAFTKHLMLGRRYRYRRDVGAILWHFGRLETSVHPLAMLAEVALANGIFLDLSHDVLGIIDSTRKAEALEYFLASHRDEPIPRLSLRGSPEEIFEAGYRMGNALMGAASATSLRKIVRELNPTRWNTRAWIAKVGIYRGLIAETVEIARIRIDFSILRDFIAGGDSIVRTSQQLQSFANRVLLTFRRENPKISSAKYPRKDSM